MKISKPGVYDISESDYHADNFLPEPSLSSSIAKMLVNATPLHAKQAHPRLNPDHESEDSDRFDIGKAAHSLVLHDPMAFAVIDAPDWRTKDAREKRDAARAAGKIPLLEMRWLSVQAMAHAARIQLDRHHEAKTAFTNGKPEMTLVWREGETWCRSRLDWLPNAGKFFDDYKSTTCADPDAFSRILFNLGYDIQCAFYRRGIKALGLHDDPAFRFVAQEVDMPHPLSVVALMPSALDLAEHKVARAIDIWQACIRTGEWPGYPLRTCYIEAPPWHEAQFLARDARAHETRPSHAALEIGRNSQAPL